MKMTKEKKKGTKKSESVVGLGLVVLVLVIGSVFAAWYYPRIGQPIYGWSEDAGLTQKYIDRYIDNVTVGMEYVVLVDGRVDPNNMTIAVYDRPLYPAFWNPWELHQMGYYDYATDEFILISVI